MAEIGDVLREKLQQRSRDQALRTLVNREGLADFCSNDYLGFAGSAEIYRETQARMAHFSGRVNGATGSRLLTGNYPELGELESQLASWLGMEAALAYNSGYAANLGFFSSVPGKGDWVLYDAYCHASIRDGIGLGRAKAYKFAHNSLPSLDELLAQLSRNNPGFNGTVYVVTESVFSMDGDSPDLNSFADFCTANNCLLVVDEAHGIGPYSKGLVAETGIQDRVFAQIITFGKAFGAHGAAVLGARDLKDYLLNFSRSQIYSTALPPHTVAGITVALEFLQSEFGEEKIIQLRDRIAYFKNTYREKGLQDRFSESDSAIHNFLLPGNKRVKQVSQALVEAGFDVRPILSPTVPQGRECLRFCLHSFNTYREIDAVLTSLATSTAKT